MSRYMNSRYAALDAYVPGEQPKGEFIKLNANESPYPPSPAVLAAVRGEEGSLLMRDQKVTYCCPETNNEWREPETLPEAKPSPLAQWALAEKPEDISEDFGIDAAVRLTKVMEMAYADPKE